MPSGKQSSFSLLLNDRIKEVTRNARNTVNRDTTPWFRRGEVMSLLAKALENKADTIVLDGQKFDIRYDGDRAHVTPSNGNFVPCAHFDVAEYIGEWGIYEQATRVTRLSDPS